MTDPFSEVFGDMFGGSKNPFNSKKDIPRDKVLGLMARLNSNIVAMEKAEKEGRELSERGAGKKEAYYQILKTLREITQ